jgi:pimeloyl-ACP methyl ester carboxylesterase
VDIAGCTTGVARTGSRDAAPCVRAASRVRDGRRGSRPIEGDPEGLAHLDIRTRATAGELDLPDLRDGAEALARALARTRHLVIEGAGHLAPLETPEAFRKLLLSFLS